MLRKTLEARLPVILVINKVDRPDARIASRGRLLQLFMDLDATEEIEFDRVRVRGRSRASLVRPDGHLPDSPDLEPLFAVLRDTIPLPPTTRPAAPGSGPDLDASSYLGRIALCRMYSGQLSAASRSPGACDGTIERVKVSELA